MTEPTAEYDSPWKDALERWFRPFMMLLFAGIAREIDWSRGWEFLETELQQIVRDAELGRRYADKLVKVWRKNGEEAWVLIHIEIQAYREAGFPGRMFGYNYRIYDAYGREVCSLAVLADADPDWRPNSYGYELWGCEVGIKFPVVKLLDWRKRWDKLEKSKNPAAVVVMAHLEALATQGDPEARLDAKWRLVRRLYERGFSRQDILELFRFIDWVMALPVELEQRFDERLVRYEKERKMKYVSSLERMLEQRAVERGMEKGMEKGQRRQLTRILRNRFGSAPKSFDARLQGLSPEQLEELVDEAFAATSLDDFMRRVPAPAPGSEAAASAAV